MLIRMFKQCAIGQNKNLLIVLINKFIDNFFINKEVYLCLSKIKESNEMKVFKKLVGVKGNLFLDIGACYGGYALRFSNNFTKVVAFEPDQHNFTVSRLLVKLFRKRNIRVRKVAVSNQDGLTKLFLSDSIYEHTIKPEFATAPNRFKLVKAISLNNFVKEPIDLIKVDVQGSTFDVLLGATQVMEKIKRWMIELETYELQQSRKIENFLKSFNYKVAWVSDQHIYAHHRC